MAARIGVTAASRRRAPAPLLGGLGLVLLRLLGRLGLLVHVAPLSGRSGPSPTSMLPAR